MENVQAGIGTNKDLKDACDNVVFESLIPDRKGEVPSDPTVHEDHMGEDGWYSERVLADSPSKFAV